MKKKGQGEKHLPMTVPYAGEVGGVNCPLKPDRESTRWSGR